MKRKGKIRWGTAFWTVVGVVSALGDPDVLAYLPAKIAAPVAGAAVVVLALKKALLRDEHEREPGR